MISTMPVTPEEMIQRAAALVPRLRERAERTEQLRRLPDETIADLVDSGLLRIGNPDRFGGVGLDIDTAFVYVPPPRPRRAGPGYGSRSMPLGE